MKLGYTIVYVSSVEASLRFFESAFGLERRFLHESGSYGELETGETTLAFASFDLGDANVKEGLVYAKNCAKALGFELAFVSEEVSESHARAVEAGAMEVAAPIKKPWGQIVSYLRCPEGILIELCTPIS